MNRIIVVAIAVAFLASPIMACEKGCFPFEGTCACDQKPEAAPSVLPSDEKPLKSGIPSYQAEGIKAEMPQSLIYQDSKLDQEKTEADTQGKIAAGIQKQ